ncbi:IS1/IS1595 family N-terminal zinc-binding domain-containing protein [Magnetococcus sp. PR-3]|uniref:IS1/IS1595 family N-terminal zinc-binding domain-containing protein n=1 Tax=Magnetococcus sp. PR-3 TaxID=3120355 RepID=UPI002FCE3C83
MATMEVHVHCPDCGSLDVIKFGKDRHNRQRFRCNDHFCERTIFMMEDPDWWRFEEMKKQIAVHLLSGNGIQQTASNLGLHPDFVTRMAR